MRGSTPLRLAFAFGLDVAILAAGLHTAAFVLGREPRGPLPFVALAVLVVLAWCFGLRTPALRALGCSDVKLRHARFEPPSRESWPTLVFGALAILQGVKELIRLPQFHVPAPLFGIEPTPHVHAGWIVLTSAASIVSGLWLLRLRRIGLQLALGLAAITLASAALGWSRMDGYVERLIVAKRQWEGAPVTPGEIERLKRVMPLGQYGGVLIAATGLVLLRRRFEE